MLASRNSAKIVTVADLYTANQLVLSNVPVTSADVTSDLDSDVLRSAHITIVNPRRVDASGAITSGLNNSVLSQTTIINNIDLLNTEVVLKTGYKYSNQEMELVTLGRFLIWDANIDFTAGDVIDLELYDRAKYLDMTNMVRPYDFSGALTSAAIQTLVTASLPFDQTVAFGPGLQDVKLAGGSTYDTTHLDAIQQLAEAMGGYFFFNAAGIPTVNKKAFINSTVTSAQSVLQVDCDEDQGNAIRLGRQVSRDGVYNGIGVYGTAPSSTSAQPMGEAYDLDSSSRTYWNGSFGKSFQRIDRPELTSAGECQAAAMAELALSISTIQPSTFQMLPNAALEPGDIITIVYPDDLTTELHLVKSIEFSPDSQTMDVTTAGRNVS
jgi:hypothetical protein